MSETKKPADTPFKQQRLPAWQPILSPPWVICCFFLVAAVFIPIGALVIVASDEVVEYETRYDDHSCETLPPFNPKSVCATWVKIDVKDKMEHPVYLYYKLDNFYQNHRRYAKSRSDGQLAGQKVLIKDVLDCEPFRYPDDLSSDKYKPSDSDISSIYAPCGLIAWSMFNDSFEVYIPRNGVNCKSEPQNCQLICRGELAALPNYHNITSYGEKQECSKSNIAWKSDREKKFKEPDSGYYHNGDGNPDHRFYYNEGQLPAVNNADRFEGHVLPLQNDEDFMVWMRTASLPSFRKLYRRFDNYDFPANSVVWIRILNRFPVGSFSGKKYVILSTTTWIGGKNYFLGAAYIVVGCLCFLLALVFLVKHIWWGRTPGELMSFVNPQEGTKPN